MVQGYDQRVSALEIFYICVLVASAGAITWFSVYVLYRLLRTHR
jgi:hypothetical protein